MNLLRRLVLTLAATVLLAGPAFAEAPGRLTVFAAASLKNALDEVNQAYARTGAPAPAVSYAGSSILARQLEQGAAADVFLSADTDWMDYAAQRKLVRPQTRRDLLTNRLALVAPKASPSTLAPRPGFALAQALGSRRLAMAGLEVPAGRYGKQALTSLGVWNAVASKVAYSDNVRSALAFVARGEAPFGIVYDTDAMVQPGVRIVGLFPESSHSRIVYPGAVTAASTHPAAAPYVDFLSGPQASAIFRKYGFKTLPAQR